MEEDSYKDKCSFWGNPNISPKIFLGRLWVCVNVKLAKVGLRSKAAVSKFLHTAGRRAKP